MDKAKIDIQVLSLGAPGIEAFNAPEGKFWARKTNDALAKTIKQYPDRFLGLASLPVQEPDSAAEELERANKDLGLSGALINSHVRGNYLDDKKFRTVFTNKLPTTLRSGY